MLASLTALLLQPVISSVVRGISVRRIKRAGIVYMDKDFQFHSIVEAISRLLNISITTLDLITFFQEIVCLQ